MGRLNDTREICSTTHIVVKYKNLKSSGAKKERRKVFSEVGERQIDKKKGGILGFVA